MLPQCLAPCRTDTFNMVQDRNETALAPQMPVIRDSKPVRLIADSLQQLQLRRMMAEDYRITAPFDKDFFYALGQADDRCFTPGLPYDRQCGMELTLAAIDDN